jgi:hypothetical protein
MNSPAIRCDCKMLFFSQVEACDEISAVAGGSAVGDRHKHLRS